MSAQQSKTPVRGYTFYSFKLNDFIDESDLAKRHHWKKGPDEIIQTLTKKEDGIWECIYPGKNHVINIPCKFLESTKESEELNGMGNNPTIIRVGKFYLLNARKLKFFCPWTWDWDIPTDRFVYVESDDGNNQWSIRWDYGSSGHIHGQCLEEILGIQQ